MSKKSAAAPKKAAPTAPPIPEGSAEAAVLAASAPVANGYALALSKMHSLIEIYTPSNQTREPALAALHAELAAFEIAVREDEAHKWRLQLIEAHAPGVMPNVPAPVGAVVPTPTAEALPVATGMTSEAQQQQADAAAENLRNAQANGTSGDIALGIDKEAMKREAGQGTDGNGSPVA